MTRDASRFSMSSSARRVVDQALMYIANWYQFLLAIGIALNRIGTDRPCCHWFTPWTQSLTNCFLTSKHQHSPAFRFYPAAAYNTRRLSGEQEEGSLLKFEGASRSWPVLCLRQCNSKNSAISFLFGAREKWGISCRPQYRVMGST